MLRSTFLHLKGFGLKKERSLWQQGVVSWEDYVPETSQQAFLLAELEPDSPLLPSIEAFKNGDMSFFAESLPSPFHYRIPLSFPEETIFLDIETTGLSHYYDIITLVGWSVKDEFGVWVNGSDETAFREAISRAKAIVTFNGTMFDLKFINKFFPDLDLPKIHVDLRFLAKKAGLTGGQKAIEKEIGFARDEDVDGMLGEAAPILWHKYRRGDNDALKRLIVYNHEDIEGMKAVFDSCIERLVEIENIPSEVIPKFKFTDLTSNIVWAKSTDSDGILVTDFKGSAKPLITYEQLNEILPLDSLTVMGIDLVSSEDRESGCCELKGHVAKTCRLKTDDEIIQWILSAKADLVSIDSPLSIPEGRTSFFDEDPHRDYGIMRICERTLKKRGVNVYPCLIPSMQKLTRRGMTLAEKIRQLGIPVIESYPGAAQDIMSIPRKQAGLEYLIQGLHEFGVDGEYVDVPVSHDELDAITSAIVGLFFWTGMFEGLGVAQEEYLIIPDLNGDWRSWINRKIIAPNLDYDLDSEETQSLKDIGYQICNFKEVNCRLKKHKGLRARSKSLAKEMGIKINLCQKWLGKKFVDGYKKNNQTAVLGISGLDDIALFIECFGPSFKLVEKDDVAATISSAKV